MVPNVTKSVMLAMVFAVPVAVAVASPGPGIFGPAAPEMASDLATDVGLTESFCADRDAVGVRLRDSFGEEPTLAALTGTGMTMELWTSERAGTWTMVHHASDGISCIVTTGTDWSDSRDAAAVLDLALEQTVHQS